MKKLVIAAFAVAFAAVAQAASINWGITNVYGPGQTAKAPTTYTALLFVTQNTTDVTGFTIASLDSVVSNIKANKFADVMSASSASKAFNLAGTVSGATNLSSDFSSGSLSAFAILFDTTTALDLSTASNYYVVNEGAVASVSFTSASGAKTLNYGSQLDNSKLAIDSSPAAWQSIPEPTSGLLLLIGMAGLALKRKQA